jgi:hypothetical protein
LDDEMNQVSHGLWLLGVQEDMIFPVEEVHSGEGLINEKGPTSLQLAIWIILHGPSGLPEGHLGCYLSCQVGF